MIYGRKKNIVGRVIRIIGVGGGVWEKLLLRMIFM